MEKRECTKVAYGTELEAYMALETIQQKGKIMETTPIRSYECPYCGKYHLTSKRYDKSKDRKGKKRKDD